MPHDEITKDPRTVSALTGLPLVDVLEAETCDACEESGAELHVRTYYVDGQTRRLCRSCSDAAAYEAAERSRARWARVQAERAYAQAEALSRSRLTPDDVAPGCDAHDRYWDR